MQRDVRGAPEFRAVMDFYAALFAPGTGHVYDANQLAPDRDGEHVFFTGLSFQTDLEAGPSTRLYRLNLDSGERIELFNRPGRLARPSPARDVLACMLAFDGGQEAICIATRGGQILSRLDIDGLVEQIEWSADGKRLLLVVAGAGADVAGYLGGYATSLAEEGPDWLPDVATGEEANLWRRLWIFDPETGKLTQVSAPNTNVWEACWFGSDHAACICSDDHSEGSWYRANLRLIAINGGAERVLHTPPDQIGLPTASPDGSHVAYIGAVCSDRGIICGQLYTVDGDGRAIAHDTKEVEVTSLAWRNDQTILFCGHRAFETVLGDLHVATARVRETWRSEELTFGPWYPSASPLPGGRALVMAEAYQVAPYMAVVDSAGLQPIHSFAAPDAHAAMRGRGQLRPATWRASDGLEIHGWMIHPDNASAPAPLVLDIHGGPVWASRNRWMARGRAAPMLANMGCAVLYVNPRGSSTRGQTFARLVYGDMGGADTGDFISAIDHFVAQGLADVTRLACTGTSYGGFMSSWLVTQDKRFAAAAPISPVTNWFSQHHTSQIPHFDVAFLDADHREPGGKYFTRSPVMYADRVVTPCLNLAGALDKNTPPTQALEFHQALREAGAQSVLVIYPKDGHSLRGYPAYLDSAARILAWFSTHLRLNQRPD